MKNEKFSYFEAEFEEFNGYFLLYTTRIQI